MPSGAALALNNFKANIYHAFGQMLGLSCSLEMTTEPHVFLAAKTKCDQIFDFSPLSPSVYNPIFKWSKGYILFSVYRL